MKLRKLARQLAAAAVAGAMALSLCMPALAQTWNISNGSHGFSKVDSVCVTGTTSGRTVELFVRVHGDRRDRPLRQRCHLHQPERAQCAGERGAERVGHHVGGYFRQRCLYPHLR